MALPLTLSNYAIPFSEDITTIEIMPVDGFSLSRISVTGFARRSCVINSFMVYSADPSVVVQMDIRGIGLVNYYADLESGEGDFYEQENTSKQWVKFSNDGNAHEYVFEFHPGLDVEMLGIYGDGHIMNVELDIPAIRPTYDGEMRTIPLSFSVVGWDTFGSRTETGVINLKVSDLVNNVNANWNGQPYIKYVENLATRVNTSSLIVLHGENFTKGMDVYITQGDIVYTVDSKDVKVNTDGTEASFLLSPGMLAVDGHGMDMCGVYGVQIGFNPSQVGYGVSYLIRYKYDSDNYNELQKTPARYTGVGVCFAPSDMSLVYDNEDEFGNGLANPSGGLLGKTLYVRVSGDCTTYKYVQVRMKINHNFVHKQGERYIDGIQLWEGDVVWLTHQGNPDEDGLWVVSKGDWQGYGDSRNLMTDTHVCPDDCYNKPTPAVVDDTYIIDLGVRLYDTVNYVCSDDVPKKYGSLTVCSNRLKPGDMVLLYNQKDGQNGVWYVTCGDWVFMGQPDANDGTTLDLSRSVIVQNDIDFCKCGETFHIDYYYLNASCYLNHLRREVKLLCSGASLVPNNVDHQVRISDYSITVGEADELIAIRSGTPGDPVKEDCVRTEAGFEKKNGVLYKENQQDIPCCAVECIQAPDGSAWCDIPKFYTIRKSDDYTNSNDTNGFTIKFWRHEIDGWHLYAYIGSGTNMSGMEYYVYHLRVNGAAAEHLVDVNEHYWFTVNGGVLATGDTETISPDCNGEDIPDGCSRFEPVSEPRIFINSFAMTDDTWDLPDGVIVDPTTGEERIRYSSILDNDEKLYSLWRIKCTTSILACRTDGELRLTCDDMDDASKTEHAVGTPLRPGYMSGMRHVWGFNYYKSVMSKKEFCAEYNKYKDLI